MKIGFIFVTLAVASMAIAQSQASQTPDCFYSGRGEVYEFNGSTNVYEKNSEKGFKLSAKRFPLGDGKYLVVETKDYDNSAFPAATTVFNISSKIGAYGPTSSPLPDLNGDGQSDGTFSAHGICTRKGHCIGEMGYNTSSTNFRGRMSTQIDETSIKTVTFTIESNSVPVNSFIDEVLESKESCGF